MIKRIILLVFVLICTWGLAETPADSLYKKAQMGIYENPDEALKIGKDLLKNEKNPDKQIEIQLLISNAYIAKRDFDASLEYIIKAKSALNDKTDEKTRINVLMSIAVQYQQMELFSKSLETLDEAENFLLSVDKENHKKFSAMGKIYAIRGMIFKSQCNPELALQKFLISEKNIRQATPNTANFANLSVVTYNIGYTYMELKNYDSAKNYFRESISFAQKSSAKSLEAFAYKGLADLYLTVGNFAESLPLFQTAERLSEGTGDLVLKEGIYKGLADNYIAIQQLDKYQYYNKLYIDTRFEREQKGLDSINRSINNQNEENQKKIKELQSKYAWINGSCIVGFLVLIFVLFYFIRKKIKTNTQLKKQIHLMMTQK